MGIVGGMGTIIGPAIGAYFLTLLGESLREIETFRILIYSAVLILCVMLFPKGLWGLGNTLRGFIRKPVASGGPQ
jgi:branched-chain amino acid transport system permease protein